jgi:transcriptional regulator with PAS, ATPase and Fis domain
MRILVSWIGHTDLRAMAAEAAASLKRDVEKATGSAATASGWGPVRTILEQERFDRIVLLSNYPKALSQTFVQSLPVEAELVYPKVTNPIDYKEIYTKVDQQLDAILSELKTTQYQLVMLLSPGTPAMAAIWVLLGKTKYPATFYQTYQGGASVTEIPFDLTLDLLPDLLRDSDAILQHLANRAPSEVEGFERITGSSKAIRLAVGRASKAALRDVNVLLSGESGTGKEEFARAMHAASRRQGGPFVAVNCAALPRELLEAELYGHEKGAFTGANTRRDGAFVRADGGTLFLDEIGECDLDLQAKLLRVLDPPPNATASTREFTPLGGSGPVTADVRVLAATNRDLRERVRSNSFREDLFYRLAVIVIRLPALRERTGDAVSIAESLLARINEEFSTQEPGYVHKYLGKNAKRFVQQYAWPGNVRELNNVLLQSVVMANEVELTKTDLELAVAEMPLMRQVGGEDTPLQIGSNFNLMDHLDGIHRRHLELAMREAGGVKTKAARLLGIRNYQTLSAQLKRLGLE